ncbi:protein takeout-like [Eupeodes corollae]|uniref:protein takeout-like n=1 Tax=Eupeodes corollae TaxID=290404 RepID=UPI002491B8E9|nr:protein takeout-like [Eupeodes corollae]
MFRRDFISIFLVILLSVLSAAEFPSDLKKCKSDDSDCHKEVLQEVIDKFHKKGHRSLNLIAFDPLEVKSLVLPKVAGSPVNIELKFVDIVLTGISKVKLHKLSGLKEDGKNKYIYEVEASFPKIELNGPYSVNGQVLVLPITGKGNSKIIFENVAAKIKGKCSLVERDGKMYLNVDKIHIDLEPKSTHFDFANLFNGDKALGENMNKFLNENWVEVYKELKPVISEAIGKILLTIANGVYSKHAYADIFLPA